MTDEMRLLMAQVDDVPGEMMGEFIRRAGELGARNVQAVSSITKKGRPGYIVYVDVPASREAEIATLFGAELGTWGYRVLAAEHHHFEIERFTVTLDVKVSDHTATFELGAKKISQPGQFTRIKVEYEDLSRICAALRERGHDVPLAVLKAETESRLLGRDGDRRIRISLQPDCG
jgi:uncharacterized protein (DUF111 family)